MAPARLRRPMPAIAFRLPAPVYTALHNESGAFGLRFIRNSADTTPRILQLQAAAVRKSHPFHRIHAHVPES